MTRPNAAILAKSFDDDLVKPSMRLLLRLGLAPRAFAMLETTGRRTGLPRFTPVGNGRVGTTFWLIAARGTRADYVHNIHSNPSVRVKIGTRWVRGTARVVPDDDPNERLAYILEHHGMLRRLDAKLLTRSTRLLGSTPIVVRIDLADESPVKRVLQDDGTSVEGLPGSGISLIIESTAKAGRGPRLHKHPYAETFVIRRGSATFTIGSAQVVGRAGQVLVAPADTPHKFSTGPDGYEAVHVHESRKFVTDWLE